MGVVVKLDMGPLLKLKAEARPKAARIVGRTAFLVEAGAKSAPPIGAPVDTGALKSSIQAKQTGELTWEVRVGQEYGAYVEFGTSKMRARPFLIPNVERQRGPFVAAMAELFE